VIKRNNYNDLLYNKGVALASNTDRFKEFLEMGRLIKKEAKISHIIHKKNILRKMRKEILDCGFKNNACLYFDKLSWIGKNVEVKSCCYKCGDKLAHLFARELIQKVDYLKYFDEDYGFWRKDVGCILPRYMRPMVCLQFKCKWAKTIPKGAA